MLKFIVILSVAVTAFGREIVPSGEKTTENDCIGKCPLENIVPWVLEYLPSNYCDQYCRCTGRNTIPTLCPSNMRYSHPDKKCVPSTDAECPNRTPVSHILTTESVIIEKNGEETSNSNENDLEKELVAAGAHEKNNSNENDSETVEAATEANLHDEATTLHSVISQEEDIKGCAGQCPETNSPELTVVMAHKDPHKLCKCNWGKPVVFECLGSLQFNDIKKACDYPYEVKAQGEGALDMVKTY